MEVIINFTPLAAARTHAPALFTNKRPADGGGSLTTADDTPAAAAR